MSTLKVTNIEHEDTTNGGIQLDSSGHVTIDGQQLPTAGTLTGRRININGAMQVAQRGTVTNAGNEYAGPDRYKFRKNDGAYTISQDSDVPSGQGFASSWKADVTSVPSGGDNSYVFLNHRIEGQDLQHLKKGTSSSESLTLSFWIKSSVKGTYIVEIYDNHNNRQISKSYTVSSANTWENKTLTYAGDTSGTLDNDNTASLELNFWFYAGSNFSSGTLNTSWASSTDANRVAGQVNAASSTDNNIFLTGIQLEVGEVATPFEHRSYGDELAKCQRYCHKYAGDASGSSQYSRFPIGVNGGTTEHTVGLPHPVSMRSCTKTLSSSVAGVQLYSPGSGTNNSSPTISINPDAQSFDVGYILIGGFTGLTADIVAAVRVLNDSDFYIIFDAEL